MEKFGEAYENWLPDLHKLDMYRKKMLAVSLGASIIFYLFCSSWFFSYLQVEDQLIGFYSLISSMAFISIFLYIFYNYFLKIYYKDEFIGRIVSLLDNNLKYKCDRCISRKEYNDCGIFNESPNRYFGSDYIEGKLDKTALKISYLHTSRKYKNFQGNTKYKTLFRGVFIIADFNRDFKGHTLIGAWNNKPFFNFGKMKPVKLESPKFEKYFFVTSDNQIEARYILTPKLMERLQSLAEKSGSGFSIAFKNSQIHIALDCSEEYIENFFPPLFSSIINFDKLKNCYKYFKIYIKIIEFLDLNTRIWSKE